MTSHLPAPGPTSPSDAPSRKDRPPEDVDEDDDGLSDDPFAAFGDDPLDQSLLDPSQWPDDLDEPTIPEGLLDRDDLMALQPIDADDSEFDDDLLVAEQDVPLLDDLVDLDAPDDAEIPILPWSLTVRLNGASLPATVDPARHRSLWQRPSGAGGSRSVRLDVAGHTLMLEVDTVQADEEGVVLAKDVLVGRFLLRP